MSGTLLCVVAHPDDETMLTGGVLAALATHGVAVHILCATRGEGGEMGEPPLCAREDLGRVREAELRCAARALGARGVQVLDYVDPVVAPGAQLGVFDADSAEFEEWVLGAINRLAPDVLLTHGSQGEYGHPGHVLVHQTVLSTLRAVCSRSAVPPPALYTFCAAISGVRDRILNAADPAHVILDVTPWLHIKAAAAMCHRTQQALFFRHHPQAREICEVLRTVEGLHLVWSTDGCQAPMFAEWVLPDGRA